MPEIEFEPVDSIAAGAVGVPGARSFYIQAEKDGQVLSVLVEKQQVAMLADRVRILLEQVETQFPAEEGPGVPLAPDAGELKGDPVPLFRAVAIGIGFDPVRRLVVLELHEHPLPDDEEEDGDEDDAVAEELARLVGAEDDGDTDGDDDGGGEGGGEGGAEAGEGYLARFSFTAAQARVLATRGSAAVERGRPPCPLCGNPLDPGGHTCPRLNGHGRHDA